MIPPATPPPSMSSAQQHLGEPVEEQANVVSFPTKILNLFARSQQAMDHKTIKSPNQTLNVVFTGV
jgi:hypothetical protein